MGFGTNEKFDSIARNEIREKGGTPYTIRVGCLSPESEVDTSVGHTRGGGPPTGIGRSRYERRPDEGGEDPLRGWAEVDTSVSLKRGDPHEKKTGWGTEGNFNEKENTMVIGQICCTWPVDELLTRLALRRARSSNSSFIAERLPCFGFFAPGSIESSQPSVQCRGRLILDITSSVHSRT